MKKGTISKTAINLAADAKAREELGLEQYSKNKNAVKAIKETFKDGVTWAMKQDYTVKANDQGHELIAKERMMHLVREFDAAHDDQHTHNELTVLAILLAADDTYLSANLKDVEWPFDDYPDKRGKLGRIRQLTIAGALIAAQLDIELRKEVNKVKEVANV